MLRKKLKNQFSNRSFVLLVIVALSLFFGWMIEYRHRQMDLVEYFDLAEYAGKSAVDVLLTIDPGESVRLLIDAFLLIAKLSPAAIFNSFPVFVAIIGIPWLASHFIHTLYDTKDLKEARQFLERNILGMTELKPLVIVKEGYVFVGAGSLYDRIGGRGFLIVYHDSAVVIERGGQLVCIKGAFLGFLKQFERIWGVVDLRKQRWPLTVNAMSKEGIPISCEAIITFKIDDRFIDKDGNEQVKLPVDMKPQSLIDDEIDLDQAIVKELGQAGIGKPLPYTDKAVFKAATSIWMRIQQQKHPEQLRRWTGRVIIGGTEGTLRNILANYRLDWLLQSPQPEQEHPREEIRKKLEEKLINSFPADNSVGAKILDVELGEIKVRDVEGFDAPEKIYTQWIKAWEADWKQRVIEDQIEGEAELVRLQAAQIRAQAEMALTLTEAIRPFVNSEEDVNSYKLVMQFIETLRWMAYDPFKRAFMPPEIMRTLDELEKAMGKAKESSDETISGISSIWLEGRGLIEEKRRSGT